MEQRIWRHGAGAEKKRKLWQCIKSKVQASIKGHFDQRLRESLGEIRKVGISFVLERELFRI